MGLPQSVCNVFRFCRWTEDSTLQQSALSVPDIVVTPPTPTVSTVRQHTDGLPCHTRQTEIVCKYSRIGQNTHC
ncbi:hypothetical protein HHUSO_G19162 [Huso huso]|uniref:Uncharacterized protein n=1 Tax=Huso huso TaxID=61971 RepID=A0ABR0Z5U9_HUSHU